jgi:hypothetical protein
MTGLFQHTLVITNNARKEMIYPLDQQELQLGRLVGERPADLVGEGPAGIWSDRCTVNLFFSWLRKREREREREGGRECTRVPAPVINLRRAS